MPNLTIDNRPVEASAGEMILQAARRLGIDIPTLCHREGCTPETSCLVCVVRVNGGKRLVPACATPVAEGMVVESETADIHIARRTALELLLSDHLGDCLGPCQMICPAHLDIPGMIRLIEQGRMAEAVALVKQRLPIPAILGRICPEICERGCRRSDVDTAVSIKLLKRQVGDWDLAQERPWQPALAPASGCKVAVVGAGPAGLSAAYYLRAEGHAVTVFDQHEQPGGGLRYCVPEEELPREVLEAELRAVLLPGIEMRSGVALGPELTLEQLTGDYDAVLLACGEISVEQAGALGLDYAHHGLQVDRDTLLTPRDKVFACGSAVSPSHHAARSVGSGRLAALSIGRFLRASAPPAEHRPFNVPLGKLDAAELAKYAAGASREGRVQPQAEGLSAQEAVREAARCLHCECAGLSDCRLRHWAARYGADTRAYHAGRRKFEREVSHSLVVYEPGKCIHCGLCVQIARRAQEPLGLSHIGRGFDVRVGVPWGEALAEGLAEAARECARACPTGALVLRGERL